MNSGGFFNRSSSLCLRNRQIPRYTRIRLTEREREREGGRRRRERDMSLVARPGVVLSFSSFRHQRRSPRDSRSESASRRVGEGASYFTSGPKSRGRAGDKRRRRAGRDRALSKCVHKRARRISTDKFLGSRSVRASRLFRDHRESRPPANLWPGRERRG